MNGDAPALAEIVTAPAETRLLPLVCVMAPSVLTRDMTPEVERLPTTKPPAVSAILASPVTTMLPATPWLNAWLTASPTASDVLPPVCVSVLALKAPAPLKEPPACAKAPRVVTPALLSAPPFTVSAPSVIPPDPRLKAPSVCVSAPPKPPRLSRLTGSEASAGACAPAVLNATAAPLGMMTLATFARSGTAPPAQLAGSNQLPELPPVHVTELSRVMFATADPVDATE